MTTGEKIAEERKKLELTQQQFAEKLGVTRQAVSRWESDLAFPETDTLITMSKMFGCSIDYLLKYDNGGDGTAEQIEEQKSGAADVGAENKSDNLLKGLSFSSLPYFEYKSKTTVFGVPLVHVNIGLGRVAKGIFSFGLVSVGVVSVGLVSVGLLAFGTVALGLISLGAISLGLIVALGAVAIGMIALGGLAIGCFSMGGCSIGLFAFGGYANGRFIAVGDYAVGRIAFGDTTSIGSQISVTKENFAEQKDRAWQLIDELPSFWKGFANCSKNLARAFMTSDNIRR